MPYISTGNLPSAVQFAFDATILSTPTANYIHTSCAVQKRLPKNSGPTLRMYRYASLDAMDIPLGDTGVVPPAQLANAAIIDATPQLYGAWMAVTEQVTLTNVDPTLNALAIRMGDQLRKTEDKIVRDTLVATASQINCVGGENGINPTEITAYDVSEIIRQIMTSDGAMIDAAIPGSNQFGTSPIRQSFIAFAHTELVGSRGLDGIDGFKQKDEYPGYGQSIHASEWGSVLNARFLVSSVGSKIVDGVGPGVDLYNVPFCAKEGYAMVKQEGYSSKFRYRDPMMTSVLGLTCELGWTMRTAAKILYDPWVVNARCTLGNG